jgi:hypothetical protein
VIITRMSENIARGKALAGLLATIAVAAAGCAANRVDDHAGRATAYRDPASADPTGGIGIESQDIVSMTDQMMRDMLANPVLAGSEQPPRVVVDSQYFRNESSTRMNVNVITDRLRVGLTRAANGRMFFLARHHVDMVEKERTLKREGVLDDGTLGRTARVAGADYRLGGRIKSLDAVDTGRGITSRYHQITFEMIDLETSQIVWGGMYEFRKRAKDDIIYR